MLLASFFSLIFYFFVWHEIASESFCFSHKIDEGESNRYIHTCVKQNEELFSLFSL